MEALNKIWELFVLSNFLEEDVIEFYEAYSGFLDWAVKNISESTERNRSVAEIIIGFFIDPIASYNPKISNFRIGLISDYTNCILSINAQNLTLRNLNVGKWTSFSFSSSYEVSQFMGAEFC